MGVSRREAEEAMDLYREGGEAVGRLLNYRPEEEPRIWVLMAGTGIWKRRHLQVFKSIWRQENRLEYNRIKQARYEKRRLAQKRAASLEATREASTEAVLNEHQASERSEGTQP